MTNEEFIKSISLEGEEWRDVVCYEELYAVSSYGRICSKSKMLPNRNGVRMTNPRLLSPAKTKEGYLKVIICKSRTRKYMLVHRIVAEAFLENLDNNPMIDHIDRDKQNNKASNLRWCTATGNMNNPLTVEHCRKLNTGREHKDKYKPIVAIKDGVVVKQYESIKSAVLEGFKSSGIINVCAGRDKSYRGYKWMYLSDYEKSLVNQ